MAASTAAGVTFEVSTSFSSALNVRSYCSVACLISSRRSSITRIGSEGARAQSTRAFARNLAKLTALPIALWDERLSTAAVERALIAADLSRAKRKAVIDQHAATYILQGALDRLAHAAPGHD